MTDAENIFPMLTDATVDDVIDYALNLEYTESGILQALKFFKVFELLVSQCGLILTFHPSGRVHIREQSTNIVGCGNDVHSALDSWLKNKREDWGV